jgi:hypothetical protein
VFCFPYGFHSGQASQRPVFSETVPLPTLPPALLCAMGEWEPFCVCVSKATVIPGGNTELNIRKSIQYCFIVTLGVLRGGVGVVGTPLFDHGTKPCQLCEEAEGGGGHQVFYFGSNS